MRRDAWAARARPRAGRAAPRRSASAPPLLYGRKAAARPGAAALPRTCAAVFEWNWGGGIILDEVEAMGWPGGGVR